MADDRLLIGIDGGQTATKAVLARIDGTILASGVGGPSDHFHTADGEAKNRRALHGAIQTALTAANAPSDHVAAIGLGLTGCPPPGETGVVDRIVAEIIQPTRIVVAHDVVTNLAGASGGGPGVVVIAGGGAIAYGVTADGREALSGGFGYLVGDEGSGFDIGRRAIMAASRASDGRGESTALEAIVRDAFGLDTMRDLPRVVYRAGFARERIALLARAVASAAQAGDAIAAEIIRSSGEELALTAVGVIGQLFAAGQSVDIFPTGGVFKAGAMLNDPFRSTLSRRWPTAVMRKPRFPPMIGGLILARRTLGLAADTTWLERVEATLPR